MSYSKCKVAASASGECSCDGSSSVSDNGLKLDKIQCALTDDTTRLQFVEFLNHVDNGDCAKFAEMYNKLNDDVLNNDSALTELANIASTIGNGSLKEKIDSEIKKREAMKEVAKQRKTAIENFLQVHFEKFKEPPPIQYPPFLTSFSGLMNSIEKYNTGRQN